VTWLEEAAQLRAAKPRHVLFLCVANSARSQMAEGIARSLAPASVKISSAGSQPSKLNPFAVKALAEVGIDISGHHSKGVNDVRADDVDAVITLCAEEVCPVWLGKAARLHWGLPDPAHTGATDAERLQAFRDVRDELRRRLGTVFVSPARVAVTLCLHALALWLLCAATMAIGMKVAAMGTTLRVHAVAAPLFASVVSASYFRRFGYTSPLPTAAFFLAFIALVDFFLVALAINRSLDMFRSVLGTWLPFGLIFVATWVTGKRMMPSSSSRSAT
jgi:arsenate reductase